MRLVTANSKSYVVAGAGLHCCKSAWRYSTGPWLTWTMCAFFPLTTLTTSRWAPDNGTLMRLQLSCFYYHNITIRHLCHDSVSYKTVSIAFLLGFASFVVSINHSSIQHSYSKQNVHHQEFKSPAWFCTLQTLYEANCNMLLVAICLPPAIMSAASCNHVT